MRIRLTLDIERSRPPEPAPEREVSIDSTLVEHSGPRPIGFSAEPGRLLPKED
jgi:hypothetical protein